MRLVVVGGGVAGVCCVEELCRLCPQDSVTFVSADKILKGVSVVARLSRTLEELALVERRLDELPYPNLEMVQDVAAGIDTAGKSLFLASGCRLPYDKLCICTGARPRELPAGVFQTVEVSHTNLGPQVGGIDEQPAERQQIEALQQQQGQDHLQEADQQRQQHQQLQALQQRVLTIRDTDSVQRLAARLRGAQRVAVVGNGGIALELISGLKGMDVTWVMRHGHIGDAFFDLDAAQFLLEELRRQREQQQDDQEGKRKRQDEGFAEQGDIQQPVPPPQQQQLQQVLAHAASERAPPSGTQPAATGGTEGGGEGSDGDRGVTPCDDGTGRKRRGGGGGGGKVLGHAVGPRWMQQLLPATGDASNGSSTAGYTGRGATDGAVGGTARGAAGARLGRVEVEYGAEVACLELLEPVGQLGGAGQQQDGSWQQQVDPEQGQQQHHTQEGLQQERQPQGDPQQHGPVQQPPSATSPAPVTARTGSTPPPVLLTLTNGRQVAVDLVLVAIGVAPSVDWLPSDIERAPDGGLKLNRLMQTSDPSVYAAGDCASCQWAASESPHWFQMRLWSQARNMGVYAAHCMAGVQDQMGADMAFELFTHVTRFLGHKVVLLGLYNGQRLEQEPASDLVSYSRVTEGPERTFVRMLLLRGRVQGAVLIGNTGCAAACACCGADLEETFENLIMDQLDVGHCGAALLDPDFELDHVFD